MNRWFAPVYVALVACGSSRVASEQQEEPPLAHLRCVAAISTPFADEVLVRGSVATPPLAEAVVASTVPGRIARLVVEEGDVVMARDLVAQIEDPTLGASAITTSAEVDAVRVELRTATTERVRTERMFAQGLVPQQDVDTARAREASATANLRAAESRSNLARRQLALTDLRAPRAGTVLHVFKHTGELVDGSNMSIAEIADISVLELSAEVTGGQLVGLSRSMPATVTLDAVPGTKIPAEVVAVAPAVDRTTSLGTVRLRLSLPTGLAPAIGLAGAATIPRAPRQALQIPASALRRSIEGHDEVLVCASDHVAVREVELGTRRPDLIEVTRGISPGERIAVDHVLGIEDGAPFMEQK